MVDVDSLSDAELRAKLIEFGFPVMPITGTTRKVMAKKLKLLLENKNKIGKDNRRSLGRYSSEDESDSDTKTAKRDKYKRATMAAPLMQPPPSNITNKVVPRKSSRFDSPSTSSDPGLRKEVKTTTTTTRTMKILHKAGDEFDTGSESDEVAENYKSYESPPKRESPIKTAYSDVYKKTLDSSIGRGVESPVARNLGSTSPSRLPSSFISASSAAEAASDRLSQIRSRLSQYNSGYDRPLYTSSPAEDPLQDKESTPFLSNFTKRLSQLSESPKSTYDYKSDIIKESDVNGSGSNARNYLNSYRTTRGRPTTYDYKLSNQSIFKNNFVPFMVLIVAFLFFIVVGVVYLGIRSDTALEVSAKIPICALTDPSTKRYVNCVMEDEGKTAIKLLKVLKPELVKRAIANVCDDPKIKPYMTEQDIMAYVKSRYPAKNETLISIDVVSLEVLSFLNPFWGISVLQLDRDGEDFDPKQAAENMERVNENKYRKVTALMSQSPDIPWKCYICNKLSAVFSLLTSVVGGVLVLYVLNSGYKQYKQYRHKQCEEEATMVENIIDVLQSNCGENDDNYLVINHVRDMILPIADRKNKEKVWARAVRFINENESRIRTEIQVVRGEPSEVWRWLGNPNLNANKSWQGQAFETQVGSVNSLPCSPTPCLKIRGMVEEGDRNTHVIKKAVLSKCAQQCRILHCAVDTKSNCVYLKCADPSDAAVAYRNLHGWWYAGNLVTVKYLRLERYMQRFPESPAGGPPFLQ